MKKLSLLLLNIIFLSIVASGQTNLGVQTGVNISSIRTFYAGNRIRSSSAILSFHVRAYTDIFLDDKLSLQPGISLNGRGGKEGESFTTYTYQSLDVPVNLLYHVPWGNGSIYMGTGIFVGVNLSGRIKSEEGGSSDLDFGPILESSETEWKRIDYGINFLTGYKLSKGFLINAGYCLGMADIDPGRDWKRNTRLWSIGIGYEF